MLERLTHHFSFGHREAAGSTATPCMPRTGHRGQRSEAAQNRRVERGAGLRKAGANLTQVERDAVNRLIARDLARIDGDGDADGTLHSAGGGHRQDESREQRVESAHQHSAGRHVRRFEHGRHEAAVEAHRVRRQRGGLDQVPVKCEHCGIKGHRRSECRKLKAEQAAMARSTPSSSTSAADGELTAKKRKRDIAALEKQLAELKLEELSSLESVVETVELSAVEWEPHVEIGALTTSSKLISVGMDSGAEITVWPPELAPETPTEESDESRLGVKYFGPGDKNGPTLVNHGRRRYVVKVGGLERILKAHVVPVRKPLLAVCDLLATGHDVHFTAKGSWVEHRKTGEVINFIRRGGKFEIDVEVQPPNLSGNGSGRALL